jgi:hypothetical protein
MAGSEKWGLAFVVILLVAVIVAAVLMKCGRISSLALIALIFVALVLFPGATQGGRRNSSHSLPGGDEEFFEQQTLRAGTRDRCGA